jgi:hypothetical protein
VGDGFVVARANGVVKLGAKCGAEIVNATERPALIVAKANTATKTMNGRRESILQSICFEFGRLTLLWLLYCDWN